jgi:hypothetical protein
VAWAPWWGNHGSIIAGGGGHSDGDGNSLYRIDVESRLVTQIKSGAPVYYKADNYCADTTTGWLWANANAGDNGVQVGEPFTSHFYSYLLAIPPDSIAGRSDAPNGWLFTPGRRSMPRPGQLGTAQAHKLALGTGVTKWELHGGGATSNAAHGGACYDPVRKRVWYVADNPSSSVPYRDLATGAQGSQSFSGSHGGAFDLQVDWHFAAGVILIYGNKNTSVWVADPVAGTITHPSSSGTPTFGSADAWGWSDVWNALFMYPGEGGNTIWFCKPSGNPRTATWVWSSQTITGTIRAAHTESGGYPSYNRLRHVATLGNVLVWCPRCDVPVQLLHVRAP